MAVVSEDPYSARNFLVRIRPDSDPRSATAQFSRVSGLGVEIDVVEYRAGNQKTESSRKFPGRVHYENLVLERGVIGDLGLWEWVRDAVRGKPERVQGSIDLLGDEGEPVLTWTFTNGWPCRYRGPSLDADGSSVALETLEICHEGLRIE